jgi:hypothetical protein
MPDAGMREVRAHRRCPELAGAVEVAQPADGLVVAGTLRIVAGRTRPEGIPEHGVGFVVLAAVQGMCFDSAGTDVHRLKPDFVAPDEIGDRA